MLVKNEIEKVRSMPKIEVDRLEQWAPFAAKVQSLATMVSKPATMPYNSNAILIDELAHKLPAADQLAWSNVAEERKPTPLITDFAKL